MSSTNIPGSSNRLLKKAFVPKTFFNSLLGLILCREAFQEGFAYAG